MGNGDFRENVSAMTFSQPVKIGMINVSQVGKSAGGVSIEGATYNDGEYFSKYPYNVGNNKSYGKGISRFGDGEDALYFHYDMYKSVTKFGGKNISNTVDKKIFCDEIYKITSDGGVTLYPIRFIYGSESLYTIIGRQKDGKWVTFINSDELARKYLGFIEFGTVAYPVFSLSCEGDTLVMKYRTLRRSKVFEGEFRFKWDDAAQWFGIEHIVY